MTATSGDMDALQKSVGSIQQYLDAKSRYDKKHPSFASPGLSQVSEYDSATQKFKNSLLLRSDLERLVAFATAAFTEVERPKEPTGS